MKTNIRRSSLKRRKKTGFLTRMKTRGGRAVIARQRRRRRNMKMKPHFPRRHRQVKHAE